MTKILHTSDWHLGRLLYGQGRDAEFSAFLSWLLQTLIEEQIEILLVAGDIFDTTTPTHQAQAQYYEFLAQVGRTGCRHVVIVGGNHDSPSFLNAPQGLLSALNVHVVGQALAPADEVLLLDNAQGEPCVIVCAVPYLRERDVRQAQAGESMAQKAANYVHGVRAHYEAVAAEALARRKALGVDLPIVAMGHIFTVGGQTLADDGVRDLVVGGLGHIQADVFDEVFDYVALGHLHVPQMVGQRPWVRYSGSPVAMGFGEAGQQKSVCVLQFEALDAADDKQCFSWQRLGRQMGLRLLPIPVFQPMQRISGDWEHICSAVAQCRAADEPIWLEIIYTGDAVMGELREQVNTLLEGSKLRLIRLQNQLLMRQILQPTQAHKALTELSPIEVFEQRMQAQDIAPEQRAELLQTYKAALALLAEQED